MGVMRVKILGKVWESRRSSNIYGVMMVVSYIGI